MNYQKKLGQALLSVVLLVFSMSANAVTTRTQDSVIRYGSPTQLALKAGILAGAGDALPGMEVQIATRLNTDAVLYGGVESGLYFYSGVESAAVIPILGTLFTRFTANPNIHPTLGVSAGPALTTGAGFSTARFMLLFNPGIEFDLGGAELAALARFGVLGSTFIAAPQLGIIFPI